MIEHVVLTFEWLFSKLTDDDALNNWASLITIISLAGTPSYYFIQKWFSDRSERKQASRNLYVELSDTLDSLDETEHDDLIKADLQDKEIFFMNRVFNHDFYDSLISSGKINFLKPELQQPIQDIFQHIKDHNAFLGKIRAVEDDQEEGEDISPRTRRYYEGLGRNEEILLELIPKMQKSLKKEFRI